MKAGSKHDPFHGKVWVAIVMLWDAKTHSLLWAQRSDNLRWSFPGGKFELGATKPVLDSCITQGPCDHDLSETMVRECYEELNIHVDNFIWFTSVETDTYMFGLFLIDKWHGEIKLNDEHVDYKWRHFTSSVDFPKFGVDRCVLPTVSGFDEYKFDDIDCDDIPILPSNMEFASKCFLFMVESCLPSIHLHGAIYPVFRTDTNEMRWGKFTYRFLPNNYPTLDVIQKLIPAWHSGDALPEYVCYQPSVYELDTNPSSALVDAFRKIAAKKGIWDAVIFVCMVDRMYYNAV